MAESLLSSMFGGFRTERKPPPSKPVGAPGFAVYSGYVVENELNPKLGVASQRYRLYADNMANVAVVAAGVRFFLDLVGKAQWSALPSEEGNAAQQAADFVEMAMEMSKTPWRRVTRRASMHRFYGFSLQEWTSAKVGQGDFSGQIVFGDIRPRPQASIEKWDTDTNGQVLGAIQISPQSGEEIYIPRARLIYAHDDALSDNPYGVGVFRHIVDEVERLKSYLRLEAVGYEKDMRGVPIGRAPLTELQDLKTKGVLDQAAYDAALDPFRKFITNQRKESDTGILVDSEPYRDNGESESPSGGKPKWDMGLIESSGMNHEQINKAIQRINMQLAVVLGVESLLLGSGEAGSFALSKSKAQNLSLVVESTQAELRETMQRDFVDRLWELNGFDARLKPKLHTEDTQFKDVMEMAAALRDIASAGAPVKPGDAAVDELFLLLGLTPPEDATITDEI